MTRSENLILLGICIFTIVYMCDIHVGIWMGTPSMGEHAHVYSCVEDRI